MAKIQVYYEVFEVTHPSIDQNRTLVLSNPASIKFIAEGLSIAGFNKFITINEQIALQPYTDTLTGISTAPYELILENNSDEIDVTQYQIRVPAGAILKIICKYIKPS
jgi:hypothetical protein